MISAKVEIGYTIQTMREGSPWINVCLEPQMLWTSRSPYVGYNSPSTADLIHEFD